MLLSRLLEQLEAGRSCEVLPSDHAGVVFSFRGRVEALTYVDVFGFRP